MQTVAYADHRVAVPILHAEFYAPFSRGGGEAMYLTECMIPPQLSQLEK